MGYDQHVGLFGTFDKDVNKARELWAKSSLFMKLVFVASIFLTLADVVFEWRGFVLQTTELQRDWFGESLTDSTLAALLWFFFW